MKRKLISLLTAVAMVFAALPVVAENISANGTLLNTSGNTLKVSDVVINEDKFNVSVELDSSNEVAGTIIAALYDDGGNLCSAAVYNAAETVEISVEKNDKYKTLKLFWWYSGSTMLPMAETVSIDLESAMVATPTPTLNPSAIPTTNPTEAPTANPTATQTANPTAEPTVSPTVTPTTEPTSTPETITEIDDFLDCIFSADISQYDENALMFNGMTTVSAFSTATDNKCVFYDSNNKSYTYSRAELDDNCIIASANGTALSFSPAAPGTIKIAFKIPAGKTANIFGEEFSVEDEDVCYYREYDVTNGANYTASVTNGRLKIYYLGYTSNYIDPFLDCETNANMSNYSANVSIFDGMTTVSGFGITSDNANEFIATDGTEYLYTKSADADNCIVASENGEALNFNINTNGIIKIAFKIPAGCSAKIFGESFAASTSSAYYYREYETSANTEYTVTVNGGKLKIYYLGYTATSDPIATPTPMPTPTPTPTPTPAPTPTPTPTPIPVVDEDGIEILYNGTCGDELTWTLNDAGKLHITGTGDMENYSDSSSMPWYSYLDSITTVIIDDGATSVGDYAFYNCTALTSVALPDSLTSIGKYAFRSCSGLASIEFSDNLDSINEYAFRGCSGLTTITIPDSVTSVGCGVFQDCTGLMSITLPFIGSSRNASGTYASVLGYIFGYTSLTTTASGTTKQYYSAAAGKSYYIPSRLKKVTVTDATQIPYGAFYNCTQLTDIIIQGNVTSIGKYAFSGCTGLKNITLPDSVTSVADYAFYTCSALTNLYISDINAYLKINFSNNYSCPMYYADNIYLDEEQISSVEVSDTITEIPMYAFHGCTSLTSISFPDNLTTIGGGAFSGCTGLTSITLPDSLNSIGGSTFRGCTGLTSIILPAGLTSIGTQAFLSCTGLTNITLPNSITSIGEDAFRSCTGLTSLYISDMAAYLNIEFSSATSNPMYYANKLYLNGELLTALEVPDTITEIPMYAFYCCTDLTSITLPDSLTSIGSRAFSGCTGLTSVTLPDNLHSIGSYAFSGCSNLAVITLPTNLTSIGSSAFNGCTNLTRVYISDIASYLNIEFGSYLSCPMHYASMLYIDNKLITNVEVPDTVTVIPDYAFNGCTSLTSITLPDNLTSVGNYAFSDCTGLTSIILPDSVNSIGNGTFSGCTGLTSMTLPNSLNSIGNYAFRSCANLTNITLSDSLTSIGDDAFSKCTNLSNVYISDINVYLNIEFGGYLSCPLYYGGKLYMNNELVSELEVPDTITTISDYAFGGYTYLTSITLSEGVVSIGYQTFNGCSNLKNVTLPISLIKISDYAFANCTTLSNVYYIGSESEWAEISIGSDNTYLTDADITYNYTAEE